MHSLVGRMCLEAGNDLWRDWTLAGALGVSVVITGRTRPRENGRREKRHEEIRRQFYVAEFHP